jgi:DNA repair protein RadD
MTLEKLISRLDEENLQNILGREVIGTLKHLGPEHLYSEGLKKILINTFTNQDLLLSSQSRNSIIDCLRQEEISDLIDHLELEINSNFWEQLKTTRFNDSLMVKLFEFFGEERSVEAEVEWIQEINAEAKYPLYPYQREVLKTINSTLATPKNRVMLHMPTGSGKTRTTISYICRYLIEHDDDTNVVWFANTKELLDQAYSEFLKAWSNLGDREIKTIKYWSKSNIDLAELKGAFIVAGLGKTHGALMRDIGKMGVFANSVSLVIMDEAHQAIAPTYKLLLDMILVANKASLIGLSATPGRTWNDPAKDKKLSDFFFNQKAKIKIEGYENPVDYLVENGYLAKTNNTHLLHNSGIQLTEVDLKYLKENFVLSEKVLKEISENHLRNLAIISKVKLLLERHQRIILFAITKPHAIVLNSLLTALGVDSKVLTSETNSNERTRIIDDFKVSRVDNPTSLVLCNFGILTTGFDAPETSCAVIARPTDSLVLYSQMVGRAIRGTESGGNAEAEIVTVIDENLKGFGKVADAFMNWEDVWEDLS